MNDTLISIVIPAYNVGNYIAKGLDSCINQDYKNIDIVVVNDGSTDNTYDVCLEYSKKDSRINLINKNNGGVSSARNEGLNNAKGEYVLFLDGDDWLETDTVSFLYDLHKKYDECLITTGLFNVKNNGSILERKAPSHKNNGEPIRLSQDEAFYKFGEQYRTVSACYKIFSMKIISENGLTFSESISHGEDGLFVFQYLHFCHGLVFVDVPKWNILSRPGSATSGGYSRKFLTVVDAVDSMLADNRNSRYATIGASIFFVSRVEGLITITIRDGIRKNYKDICYLRKKLSAMKNFVFTSREFSFINQVKYFLYLKCPLYLLKMFVIFGRVIRNI